MPNPGCKKTGYLLTDDSNYIKKKRTKVDPNAPDNEQYEEMDQALVQEVEPALVAEINEDTSGEQYADECGIPAAAETNIFVTETETETLSTSGRDSRLRRDQGK